jgi:Flp pilus assembly protein TadG
MRFVRDEKGTIGIAFGLTLAIAAGAVGLAIDYGRIAAGRQQLQLAADAAALAGSQAVTMSDDQRVAAATAVFRANADNKTLTAGAAPVVTVNNGKVHVTSDQHISTFFIQTLVPSLNGGTVVISGPTGTTSTTTPAGVRVDVAAGSNIGSAGTSGGKACLLALNESDAWGINMGSSSSLDANCGVYVNNHKAPEGEENEGEGEDEGEGEAIKIGSGSMHSTFTAVVGKWESDDSFTYTPKPTRAAAPMADPFAALAGPTVGNCNFTNKQVKDGNPTTLNPGVYCGLEIDTANLVTFNPGVYIFKNAQFKMSTRSKIQGNGVMFYFTGTAANINWGTDAQVNLKAMTAAQSITATGSDRFGGMLLWSAGAQSSPHVLGSHSASVLQGAVYSPGTKVIIGCHGTVGASAEWTVWVVRSLEVGSQATLKIRSDYETSSTPLPAGLASGLTVGSKPTVAAALQ